MSRNAEHLRILRARAVADGLCQQCRCRPQKPGRKTCETCLENKRERTQAYRAVGLCACGSEPAPGLKSCEACRERARVRERERARQHKREGLCVQCSRLAAPDRTLCFEHLESSSRRNAAGRERAIARGVCGRCRKRPLETATLCAECRRIQNDRYRAGKKPERAYYRHRRTP